MAELKTTISYKELVDKMNAKNITVKAVKVLGENIDVKTILSADECETMVNGVLSMVFDDNGNYMPLIEDFAIRLFTVFAYTGVIVPNDLSDISDDLYRLMYDSDFYEQVLKVVDAGQYNSIREAINKSIKSRIEQNNSIVWIVKQLANEFSERLGGVFSEENVEALSAMIEQFRNGSMSSEAIVGALADKIKSSMETANAEFSDVESVE